MFKKWTTRFWAWMYAHARQKPWNKHLEALRTWVLNTFDPLATHAKGRDRVTDHQWNNLTAQRVVEHRVERRRRTEQEGRFFNSSRNWSGEVSRTDLNSKKRWR